MNNTDQIIISILIPSIPERSTQFMALNEILNLQIENCKEVHPMLGDVEILYDKSPKFTDGGCTVGEKRNRLVQMAKGKYLCFLDDDDDVSPDYIETILRLCNEDKDVCTFRSFFKCDTYWGLIDMSNDFIINEQATPERIIKRRAWHICAVRSEFAKKYKFENINNAEDWRWFQQVSYEIKTEAKTNRIIHQYNHSAFSSAVDAIK